MSKTIQVSLPEEGADKYVIIRNPLFLRWKEQKKLGKQDGEADLEYSNRLLKFLVVGGNITAEDGRMLAYPLVDEDIDEFTNYTIAQVLETFRKVTEEAIVSKN